MKAADSRAERVLLLHQRALRLGERAEGLGGGDLAAELVVVPRPLGLLGRLDLVEVHGVNLAAVGADGAFAEEGIVGRRLLHLGDDGLAVRRILHGGRRLEVVEDRGVDAGLHHRRHGALALLAKALGPVARARIVIPVERGGELEPLRRLQAQRVDVADEDQQPGELLAAAHDPELAGLLDGVDGVAARVGQPDDLGLRGLRLEQARRRSRGR